MHDAERQSEAHQPAPTLDSVAVVTPPSSAVVKVAESRTTVGKRKLWKTTVPAAVLVIALIGVFGRLGRTAPPPKVLNTTQITHDGVPKQDVILTDGLRLYFIETNGERTLPAQTSITGGDTSVIPTPFTNIGVTDIAPDHSRLLARNLIGTDAEGQLSTLPLAAGTPRSLSDIVGHSGRLVARRPPDRFCQGI